MAPCPTLTVCTRDPVCGWGCLFEWTAAASQVPYRHQPSNMTFMILTAGEVDLLKQLSTAGEHGRAIGILKGTELQRLVRMGFVAGDTAKYRITKWGEEALSPP